MFRTKGLSPKVRSSLELAVVALVSLATAYIADGKVSTVAATALVTALGAAARSAIAGPGDVEEVPTLPEDWEEDEPEPIVSDPAPAPASMPPPSAPPAVPVTSTPVLPLPSGTTITTPVPAPALPPVATGTTPAGWVQT